jgi:hypothetical protein
LVEKALKDHPVYNHSLFTYLAVSATAEELKYFLLNESILNLEFFDYLAFSIIGVSDLAKLEIVTNLWDEAGQGNIQRFHTTLYKNLMRDLNIPYRRDDIVKNMSWEGLAGINLFSYLSIHVRSTAL